MTSLVGNYLHHWPLLCFAAQSRGSHGTDQRGVDHREDDAELVQRGRGGDERAFDELFDRHSDRVYRWLSRLIGPANERDDLVQEVFVSVYRGLSNYRQEAAFTTWLYRIVANTAHSHLRKRSRSKERFTPSAAELHREIDRALIHSGTSPEDLAEQREQLVRALALLDRLKPKKRIAYVLRMVEERSLQEIAEIVGATPAAVGQRVKHAQRELSAMLAREQQRAEKKR